MISQGHQSVTEYFTQIKKLWDAYNSIISLPCCSTSGELCVSLIAAKKMIQEQQLMQFLVGLHEDYKDVRGNILMIKPLASLDQVYQIILQEEKQRSLSSSVSINGNSAAFHSYISGDNFKNGQFQQRNSNQGFSRPSSASYSGLQSQTSQYNSSNYKTGQKVYIDKNFQDKRPYFCDHCKIPGHSTQRCFKLHGYPPKHRLYKGGKVVAVAQTENEQSSQPPALTAEQYNQLIQILQHHTSDLDKSNENASVAGFFAGKTFCFLTKSSNGSVWIVDSGASDYVTYDLCLLHNAKKLSIPTFITMPNGKRAPIIHSGSMFLRDKKELHNVLYIPTFQ